MELIKKMRKIADEIFFSHPKQTKEKNSSFLFQPKILEHTLKDV